jgi:hypothetical protein
MEIGGQELLVLLIVFAVPMAVAARVLPAVKARTSWVMTWTGVVWREAGTFGDGGTFVQQVRLGRYTFPLAPEVGRTLEIDGEKYGVISVAGRFCHVGYGSANEIEGVLRGDNADDSSRGSRAIRWRAAGPGTT